jgi:hypothetical protein
MSSVFGQNIRPNVSLLALHPLFPGNKSKSIAGKLLIVTGASAVTGKSPSSIGGNVDFHKRKTAFSAVFSSISSTNQ